MENNAQCKYVYLGILNNRENFFPQIICYPRKKYDIAYGFKFHKLFLYDFIFILSYDLIYLFIRFQFIKLWYVIIICFLKFS